MKTEQDNINPEYYKKEIETIDCIRSLTQNISNGFEGNLVGNIIKYVARYTDKNGLEDLRKAEWYLQKLISFLENGWLDG